jgi:hypothetical protein
MSETSLIEPNQIGSSQSGHWIALNGGHRPICRANTPSSNAPTASLTRKYSTAGKK